MRIRRKFALSTGLVALLATTQVVLLLMLLENRAALVEALEVQRTSRALAVELRVSSDELTRTARTYVATGDRAHLEAYWTILSVRDGKVARPDGRVASLRSLMEAAGFTVPELVELGRSEANSNALVATEVAAFQAMEGRFADERGVTSRDPASYVREGSPDPAFALGILHDAQYHGDKESIMAPIARVERLVRERTQVAVGDLTSRQQQLIAASVVVGLALISILLASHVLVQLPVLASAQAVRDELRELATGLTSPLQRLAAQGDDELGELVTALNEAMDRYGALEERLRQSHKMESLGQLAGGIAHDFNNLLTVIVGVGDLLADHPGVDAEAKAHLAQILQSADRAVQLVAHLLAFSRQQVLQPRVVELNAVVERFSDLLRRTLGEEITLRLDLAPTAGQVRVDPAQLEQVLLNLAVNARDAMHGGGTLTVQTSSWSGLDEDRRVRLGLPGGPLAVLSVADTGVGMDAKTQARAFEPFFTTKAVGAGTGYGLATVHGIVTQSGGEVRVASTLGQGTVFDVFFPRVEGPSDNLVARSTPVPSRRASETVLLVEDEELVRVCVTRALSDAGHEVLACGSVDEALATWATDGHRVDVVLSDLVMPGCSGLELLVELQRSRPEIRVIFMSGHAPDEVLPGLELPPDRAFLAKPFTRSTLVQTVRAVLDA